LQFLYYTSKYSSYIWSIKSCIIAVSISGAPAWWSSLCLVINDIDCHMSHSLTVPPSSFSTLRSSLILLTKVSFLPPELHHLTVYGARQTCFECAEWHWIQSHVKQIEYFLLGLIYDSPRHPIYPISLPTSKLTFLSSSSPWLFSISLFLLSHPFLLLLSFFNAVYYSTEHFTKS
jgi:hypothetical protein